MKVLTNTGMKIYIEYFAKFREKSGCNKETIVTSALTLNDLFNEIDKKYNFHMNQSTIKVALNEEFTDWSAQIKDNDTVVFIQPVAGG